jgi:hypothetical protein
MEARLRTCSTRQAREGPGDVPGELMAPVLSPAPYAQARTEAAQHLYRLRVRPTRTSCSLFHCSRGARVHVADVGQTLMSTLLGSWIRSGALLLASLNASGFPLRHGKGREGPTEVRAASEWGARQEAARQVVVMAACCCAVAKAPVRIHVRGGWRAQQITGAACIAKAKA